MDHDRGVAALVEFGLVLLIIWLLSLLCSLCRILSGILLFFFCYVGYYPAFFLISAAKILQKTESNRLTLRFRKKTAYCVRSYPAYRENNANSSGYINFSVHGGIPFSLRHSFSSNKRRAKLIRLKPRRSRRLFQPHTRMFTWPTFASVCVAAPNRSAMVEKLICCNFITYD